MKRLVIASIVFNILLVICTVDDFLSLHDIRADYVSKSVLRHLHVETSEALPTWTDTALEWASVTVSWALRSILLIVNLAILFRLKRRCASGNGLALQGSVL